MKEQMAFEKNVFNKTSRTDSKCPPLARAELSDAHRHLHLDTSVPVGLTHPQAIPFSSEVLFPLLPSCSLLSSSREPSLPSLSTPLFLPTACLDFSQWKGPALAWGWS